MEKIITETKAYLERKEMSQEDLASKIGYSGTTVSQVLNKQYPGNANQILKKIAHEIGYSTAKWEILKTANYQSIHSLCSDAQEDGCMMLTYGDTGSGKTEGLTRYTQGTANCYYILATVLMKPKDLLIAIQREIGIEMAGTLTERLDSIIEKLENKRVPLLIIDDCGKLEQHSKCFGIIQLLYDRLQGRCGIVLAGTKRLPAYMNKMAAKDVMGFKELKRRVSYWLPLREGVEKKFVAAVCSRQGITQPAAIQYIDKNCTNYGDVRELIRNYNKYKQSNQVDEDMQAQVLANLKFNKL